MFLNIYFLGNLSADLLLYIVVSVIGFIIAAPTWVYIAKTLSS